VRGRRFGGFGGGTSRDGDTPGDFANGGVPTARPPREPLSPFFGDHFAVVKTDDVVGDLHDRRIVG
jgi:hypothetical protein